MTREEAITLLEKLRTFHNGTYAKSIDMAIEALKQKPRKGEWKIDEYGIYHCPFCCAINNTVYKSFCPNCGAKMDKEIEE